jgi:hypothetical protein
VARFRAITLFLSPDPSFSRVRSRWQADTIVSPLPLQSWRFAISSELQRNPAGHWTRSSPQPPLPWTCSEALEQDRCRSSVSSPTTTKRERHRHHQSFATQEGAISPSAPTSAGFSIQASTSGHMRAAASLFRAVPQPAVST